MEGWLRTQPGVRISDLLKPAAAQYVTDGLTLYLDVDNPSSYPGSGTGFQMNTVLT